MQVTLFSRDLFWGGILVLSIMAYIHGLFAHQKSKHRIDILEIEKKQIKEEAKDAKEELEKSEKSKKKS